MLKTVDGEYTCIEFTPEDVRQALYEYACKKEPGNWSQHASRRGIDIIDIKIDLCLDTRQQEYTADLRIWASDDE